MSFRGASLDLSRGADKWKNAYSACVKPRFNPLPEEEGEEEGKEETAALEAKGW